MNGKKKDTKEPSNSNTINPRLNINKKPLSAMGRRDVSQKKSSQIRYIFHRENIFLVNPLKYEILIYSTKMVFKYRINLSGMSAVNTVLDIYPLGS